MNRIATDEATGTFSNLLIHLAIATSVTLDLRRRCFGRTHLKVIAKASKEVTDAP